MFSVKANVPLKTELEPNFATTTSSAKVFFILYCRATKIYCCDSLDDYYDPVGFVTRLNSR